jgi:thiamine biosynthesis lipoprotein
VNFARRAQPWLGTLVDVGVAGEAAAADVAFAAVRRVHESMSPQRPASDIARFNAAASGASIACDPWTVRVLAAARELASASDGVFDVTLGSGGNAAWSLHGNELRKLAGDACLDLGGIAKGEAVDRAVDALRAAGVAAGWVNAGGDLRTFGDAELPILARDPDDSGKARPLAALRDGAFATSDFARDRYPLAQRRQVSVAAPLCRWADALTKIVALAPEAAAHLLPRYHARCWALPA